MFWFGVDTFQGFDFVFYGNSKKFSVSQINLLFDKKHISIHSFFIKDSVNKFFILINLNLTISSNFVFLDIIFDRIARTRFYNSYINIFD